MSTTRWRAHGLRLASPIPVGAPDSCSGDVDVTLHVRCPAPAGPLPDGEVIATLELDRPYYTLVDRGAAGFTFRFHGQVDVDVDPEVAHATCRPHTGGDPGLLPVLLNGTVVATLLLLRGHTVLHASAVEVGGRAVGIVADSGGGKSTLAALACIAGARLVADDVLRVDADGHSVDCLRGTAVVRLRDGSRALAGSDGTDRERSADGRHLFEPTATDAERLPLAAIVLPVLRHDATRLQHRRLRGQEALFRLLAIPRVHGWSHPRRAAALLAGLADLADTIPIHEVELPWGVDAASGWMRSFPDLVGEIAGAAS